MTPQHDLPGGAELLERFQTFRYSVFRLETLQVYAGSGEEEGIAPFHRGEPYTPDAAEAEYAGMVRTHRAAGKVWQRVHVVREPISDYMAYELTWEYGPHVAAGEDIRIIAVTAGEWPADVPAAADFWLFDSHEVFGLGYDDAGRWLGTRRVTDPDVVVDACFIRDAALHQSIPWADYISCHSELIKRLPKAALAGGGGQPGAGH